MPRVSRDVFLAALARLVREGAITLTITDAHVALSLPGQKIRGLVPARASTTTPGTLRDAPGIHFTINGIGRSARG